MKYFMKDKIIKPTLNMGLNKAGQAKKDEFYTQLVDIEKELKHYKDQFRGKVVYCNCDDPFESNFFKYFAGNFNALGLKRLIATSYKPSPIANTQIGLFGDAEVLETSKGRPKVTANNSSLTKFTIWTVMVPLTFAISPSSLRLIKIMNGRQWMVRVILGVKKVLNYSNRQILLSQIHHSHYFVSMLLSSWITTKSF